MAYRHGHATGQKKERKPRTPRLTMAVWAEQHHDRVAQMTPAQVLAMALAPVK